MGAEEGGVADDSGDIKYEGEEGDAKDDEKLASCVVVAKPEGVGGVLRARTAENGGVGAGEGGIAAVELGEDL